MIANCPCCGGAPACIEVPVNEFINGNSGEVSKETVNKFFITCTKCCVQTKAARFADAPLVIAAWNRRYIAPVVEKQPEAPVADPTNLDFPPPEA